MRRTLLIPALLDHHWPLLRWAFMSDQWDPVVLDTEAEELGLRYLHNDLCYPFFLIAGQVLSALQSGRYDPERTGILISQPGDGCRGSCLIRLLRPALNRAGFDQVSLVSLNVRELERGGQRCRCPSPQSGGRWLRRSGEMRCCWHPTRHAPTRPILATRTIWYGLGRGRSLRTLPKIGTSPPLVS